MRMADARKENLLCSTMKPSTRLQRPDLPRSRLSVRVHLCTGHRNTLCLDWGNRHQMLRYPRGHPRPGNLRRREERRLLLHHLPGYLSGRTGGVRRGSNRRRHLRQLQRRVGRRHLHRLPEAAPCSRTGDPGRGRSPLKPIERRALPPLRPAFDKRSRLLRTLCPQQAAFAVDFRGDYSAI